MTISLLQSLSTIGKERQSLSLLKEKIQFPENRNQMHQYFLDHLDLVSSLLSHSDKKTRKNIANLLFYFNDDVFKKLLIQQYSQEDIEFVKSAILESLTQYDMRSETTWILQQISHIDITVSQKFSFEQRRFLFEMLSTTKEGRIKFKGLDQAYPMLLTTLIHQQTLLINALSDVPSQPHHQGVLIKTQNIESILTLRCFDKLYFLFKPLLKVPYQQQAFVDALTDKHVLSFLKKVHQVERPFLFRIDGIELLPTDHTFISSIEMQSQGMLINSTHRYDIMFIVKKINDQYCSIYVQLMTLEDQRFLYHCESLSSSLPPFMAATILEDHQSYFIPQARILDPFCGTATLLIERSMLSRTRFLMGIDIYGEAIKKAKINAENAQKRIHFVQRDILTFENDQPFDEIITYMPSLGKKVKEITHLYHCFFDKLPHLLIDHGYAFLLTEEKSLIYKEIRLHAKQVHCLEEKTYQRGRLTLTLFVLKVGS